MLVRYILPLILTFGIVHGEQLVAQGQTAQYPAVSASQIAASQYGIIDDVLGTTPIIGGALYIKVRSGLASGWLEALISAGMIVPPISKEGEPLIYGNSSTSVSS